MRISEMQCKLATWSTTDNERKFDRLVRLIAHPVWIAEAARVTMASSGAESPGIDGIDKSKLEPVLAQEIVRPQGRKKHRTHLAVGRRSLINSTQRSGEMESARVFVGK